MSTPSPELINSIVETRSRQNPDLAQDVTALYQSSQKTAQTLADQGFTRVDNIVNLPGGVSVYEQGKPGEADYRSSRLTLDNAVSVVQAGIDSGRTTPQAGQQTEAPAVTVFPRGADATTAPTPATPPPAEQPQQPNNDFRIVGNGFQYGNLSGNLSQVPAADSVSGQDAQNARLNVGDLRFDNQFRASPLSPDQVTAGTTVNFSPSAQLSVDAGQNFVANGATVNAQFTNPQSTDQAYFNGVFGQNGIVANLGGAVNLGQGTLSGNVGIDQPQNTTTASVGYISNDAQPGTETTRPVPASTSGNLSVTNASDGTTVAVDGRIPLDNGAGTLTGNAVLSPTATTVGVNYQSNDGNNLRDPNQYVPPSTAAGLQYSEDRQTGDRTIAANAQLPINGDQGTLNVAVGNTSGTTNQTTVAADYTQGGNNYRANVAVGDVNQVGVGATINNGNTAFNGDVNYNLDTNRVTGAASLATGDVNNGGRLTASAQLNDQGQFAALAQYQLGDSTPPPPLGGAQAQQRVDSGVLDYRIAQLTGEDRKLYDQALAGVNALNERGENIQNPRETALSLAAAANQRGMDIQAVELGKAGADGRQNLIIANGALDNPATDRIGVDRQQAANTNGFSSLERLTENNAPQLQNRQAAEMTVETTPQIEAHVRRGSP